MTYASSSIHVDINYIYLFSYICYPFLRPEITRLIRNFTLGKQLPCVRASFRRGQFYSSICKCISEIVFLALGIALFLPSLFACSTDSGCFSSTSPHHSRVSITGSQWKLRLAISAKYVQHVLSWNIMVRHERLWLLAGVSCLVTS